MPQLNTSVPIAYLTVIIVWSTTPLAVVWSSESVSPVLAAMLRMTIAAALGTLLLHLWRIPLPRTAPALKSYSFAVLGIYGAMLLTYLAARYVPSGLISLIFGLTPMVSGLMGRLWLRERGFTAIRWVALTLALAGLARVMIDDLVAGEQTLHGIGLLLIAVLLFSASGVLIKGLKVHIHPLAQTVGALWLSVPPYLLTWFLLESQLSLPDPGSRSIGAILYLSVFGSLLGFVSYFYILQRLSPTTVALVTLVTPVIAISLGNLLNQEAITAGLVQGALLICIGLAFYHWGAAIVQRLSGTRRIAATESEPQ